MTDGHATGPRERVLAALAAAGLRVVLLHGGGTTGGDVDVLVDRPDAVPGVLAAVPGIVLVQAIRYGPEATTYVLRHDGGWLPIDVIGTLRIGPILALGADELLAGAHPRGGALAPRPAVDFAYYLTKRIAKRGLDGAAGASLASLFREDEAGCRAMLDRFLPAPHGAAVAAALVDGDWAAIEKQRHALRRAMIAHGWRTRWRSAGLGRSFGRIVGRVLRPTGVHVAVLGPDGAGKSTLIEGLAARLRPAFWRVSTRHLRPHLLRRGGAPTETPHGRPARGPWLSAMQAVLWMADYALGDALVIYPALVRSTLVLYDRYADDLAVDPVRYRFGGPPWLARLVARTAPRPDLTLVLVADRSVLRARKREVGEVEVMRQVAAYQALATERPDIVVIDAGRSAEAVLDRAAEAVTRHLARRTAHRLGLDR